MSTESLEQEIKYANLALGGNPAIQLSDRISSLLAVNKELLQALERGHLHFLQNNKLTVDDREMLDEMWAAISKARGI